MIAAADASQPAALLRQETDTVICSVRVRIGDLPAPKDGVAQLRCLKAGASQSRLNLVLSGQILCRPNSQLIPESYLTVMEVGMPRAAARTSPGPQSERSRQIGEHLLSSSTTRQQRLSATVTSLPSYRCSPTTPTTTRRQASVSYPRTTPLLASPRTRLLRTTTPLGPRRRPLRSRMTRPCTSQARAVPRASTRRTRTARATAPLGFPMRTA